MWSEQPKLQGSQRLSWDLNWGPCLAVQCGVASYCSLALLCQESESKDVQSPSHSIQIPPLHLTSLAPYRSPQPYCWLSVPSSFPLIQWMEWGGQLVCRVFERVEVFPHSCWSGSTDGEIEKERERDWLERWEEAGKGTGKDRRKGLGQWIEEDKRGQKQRAMVRAKQKSTCWGVVMGTGAKCHPVPKGDSLAGKVSLEICFWPSSRSVILMQESPGEFLK